MSALIFTLPFFYIVGFYNGASGDSDVIAGRFFYYWLYEMLYMANLVFLGQFLSAACPNIGTSGVVGGMLSTILSIFCGFMINAESIPSFWVFLYWLNPLHYALEGLTMAQFHDDKTPIVVTTTGEVTTAQAYITNVLFQDAWSYGNRYFDIFALVLFLIAFR